MGSTRLWGPGGDVSWCAAVCGGVTRHAMKWPSMVAAGGLLVVPPVWSLESDALFAKIEPSVWTVIASDAQGRASLQGSAVVVGPGQLVTNCHVLARMTRIQVVKENVSYGAKLEFPDPENDLCQLRVDNFRAPSVELAPQGSLRVGARVYAIGTPRGLETTLSDGLLSGLRRDGAGQLLFVQTTAPISSGSSGGGLFDTDGRLVGITTFTLREAQSINLAVPAYRVAELPERGRQQLKLRDAVRASAAADAGGGGSARGGEPTAQRQAGDWFEYVITDHYTKVKQAVNLRVDRVTADSVVFSGGARVEGLDGVVKDAQSSVFAELDMVTPVGGWAPGGQVMTGSRRIRLSGSWQGYPTSHDLTAHASSEETLRVGDFEHRVVRIDMRGWHTRSSGVYQDNVPYRASVWYSPALMRVVRFSVEYRYKSTVAVSTQVKETLDLVRMGRQN